MRLMILGTIFSIPKGVERDVKQEIMATLHSFQSELFPGLLQSRSQNGVIYRGHNFARKMSIQIDFVEFQLKAYQNFQISTIFRTKL